MEEDATLGPRSELLSFEEIVGVATIAHNLGVAAVGFANGEPLLRHGVVELVGSLGSAGFADLSMTTNGHRPGALATQLRDDGLQRVNISCDSLFPDRFAQIRRYRNLRVTLDAMEAAEAAGLNSLKVNVVLVAGVNDDEFLDFAQFAPTQGRIVRFIELMPLEAGRIWSRSQLIPGETVFQTIHHEWPLEAIGDPDGPAPAERFRFTDRRGEIGIVSSVTRPFSGRCNRLPLTAGGAIRNCRFSDDELSVRDLMRHEGSDQQISDLIQNALRRKLAGHGISEPGFLRPARTMSMIGG
jgi:cyclic pyranopterin phosphate synthase